MMLVCTIMYLIKLLMMFKCLLLHFNKNVIVMFFYYYNAKYTYNFYPDRGRIFLKQHPSHSVLQYKVLCTVYSTMVQFSGV